MPLLEVKHLVKSYGQRRIVDGLSFSVEEGEVMGLLGPNGAGKTTAFYITMGLIRPESGNVLFHGDDVTHLPMHLRARRGMGYLAQEPSVFRGLTVKENLLCILETLPLKKGERQQRLEELLEELHLAPLADKKAAALSGGERRRLEITRALITHPTCLLLDEPFANIDPLAIHDVKQLIKHLSQKGISVLITDHNAREIFSIVHRCALITGGKAIFSGTPAELLCHPEARSRYLGEEFSM